MTTFDEREAAFENRFAHDADLKFKVLVRRDKLLGLWAAEKLGLATDAAEAYAKSVVAEYFAVVGHEDVVANLVADLAATGVTETDIRAALVQKTAEAHHQIMEPM